MNDREYEFTMTGHTALLAHADDVEASDRLREWRQDPAHKNLSVPGDDRSPAWTWMTYLYSDPGTGLLAWPMANIMVGLRAAGAQMILKKQKTFKEVTQSGMAPAGEFAEFFCAGKPLTLAAVTRLEDLPYREQAEAVKKLGFRLYAKRAKVGQSKHIRVRARFDEWSIRGRLTVTAPEITEEALERLCVLFGIGGQGDWRPACKTPGSFGMCRMEMKRAK